MFDKVGALLGQNLPMTLGIVGIEFVIGLILGLIVKKLFKVVVTTAVLVGIGSYLGILSVNWHLIKNYTTEAIAVSTLVLTILPLGAGLVVGGIIGFLKG